MALIRCNGRKLTQPVGGMLAAKTTGNDAIAGFLAPNKGNVKVTNIAGTSSFYYASLHTDGTYGTTTMSSALGTDVPYDFSSDADCVGVWIALIGSTTCSAKVDITD